MYTSLFMLHTTNALKTYFKIALVQSLESMAITKARRFWQWYGIRGSKLPYLTQYLYKMQDFTSTLGAVEQFSSQRQNRSATWQLKRVLL